MKEIILLTGKDCHLCLEARSLFSQLDLEDISYREVDIYTKRAYVDKYWDKIPVILNGDLELTWPFSIEEITKFLD